MKKLFFIFSSLLILTIFVSAIENPLDEKIDSLNEGTEKLSELREDFAKEDFLTQNFGEMLAQTNTFKPIISFYDKASIIINPLVKYTVGKEPALEYLFILMCFIWFAIFVFMLEATSLSSFSSISQWAISFSLTTILGVTGLIFVLAEIFIQIIGLLNNWIAELVVAIGLIFLFIFARKISRSFINYLRKKKQREAEKADRDKLKAAAESAGKITEAVAEKGEEGKFEYKPGMRRGGTGKKAGRFVKKDVAKRYAQIHGDKAAKERIKKPEKK